MELKLVTEWQIKGKEFIRERDGDQHPKQLAQVSQQCSFTAHTLIVPRRTMLGMLHS